MNRVNLNELTLDEVWSTHNGCEIEIDEENNGEKLIVKLEEKKCD